jgi:hypothetical protein
MRTHRFHYETRALKRPHAQDLTYRSKIIPPRSKSILTLTCPLGTPYSKHGSASGAVH